MMNSSDISGRLIQLLIRWFFIIVPTIIIGYVTLTYLNASYTSFNSSVGTQAIYFGAGLTLSFSLYFFRARWLVTFILLWLAYWIIGRIIVKLPGEFDVFYASAMYQLYSSLFLFGWAFGFLLVRMRYSYIVIFGVLAVVTIIPVSDTIDVSLRYILLHLVPVFVYGLYMLFISPVLAKEVEMDGKKSAKLFLRFAAFLILILLAFILVESLFRSNLTAVEKELAARGAKSDKEGKDGGYDSRYGLMDKDKDDSFKLKDTMKVNSRMSSSDNLMFVSKLDNYFPDGMPKPLYFVYHYLTKYDPEKETFIRDLSPPYFDEFDVDPSSLAMYHSISDSSVFKNSLGKKKRKVVTADIYLSSNTWKHALLGPGGSFFCQAIPVEKDFQKQFKSAYKVKSYTSELNNAYFVYNPSSNPQLEMYQEERNEELRSVNDYKGVDKAFYNYYTEIPKGFLYDSISRLTADLTRGISKPMDKVLAVRDFFLQRGEDGKRIFRYTLKPGSTMDPNIPNASMLGNFLFKTHAGYCTYYAGASLLMLRSLGIPARFTTGFATINRSDDKNKGWYWFYASQAHAWTQVYFPGYGWLDFDMTIGNEDQQGAPKPDGTPPLPPPEPWLVVNGIASEAPDLTAKRLNVSFSRIIYFNEEYSLNKSFDRTVDASVCRVIYDKKDTTLSVIKPGDSIVVVSYIDEAKKIPLPRKGVKIETQVDGFPKPIIADEIHVKSKDTEKKKEEEKNNPKKQEEKSMTWQEMVKLAAIVLVSVIVLILLLPLLFLLYLMTRTGFSSEPRSKADAIYVEALYRFHMTGLERGGETPLEYASVKADPQFNAGFAEFMRVYLRLKYGNATIQDSDREIITRFAMQLKPSIRRKNGFFKVTVSYFNLLLASRYFFRTNHTESENQTISI